MVQKNHPDYILLTTISILIIWAIFNLASVSFPFSLEKYGNSWYYFLHQLLMGFLPGLIIGFVFYKLKIKNLKKISIYLLALNILLLLMVFLPKIGIEINGSQRWLQFGKIRFQPSEFLKITFLLYLSTWFGNKLNDEKRTFKKKKTDWQSLLIFTTILFILIIILLFQKSLSTLVVVAFIGGIVYFASFSSWKHFISFSLPSIGLLLLAIQFTPYRLDRVLTFLKPQLDPLGKGYQIGQSLIAIGSGKWLGIENGIALGLSRQKFGFLPEVMTDSIFAVIAEEVGFIGCLFLITLIFLFAWRGMKIALRSGDACLNLLSLGITFWIVFQTFFNIGGIIGILPLAGMPLPLFSYGSSHLIAEMAGLGLLLNISKQTG